ncbi:uncharacterized protein BcabD6B2_34010 [Babesia caballi]|uniref:Uncharacterized protein n=1 Tax=Babesia caballi TaxID=5871 RepID=A0AAV4LVU4_BABCB|nr:hypothetical protein BcabD6B2_34010 [Babesia caballi]
MFGRRTTLAARVTLRNVPRREALLAAPILSSQAEASSFSSADWDRPMLERHEGRDVTGLCPKSCRSSVPRSLRGSTVQRGERALVQHPVEQRRRHGGRGHTHSLRRVRADVDHAQIVRVARAEVLASQLGGHLEQNRIVVPDAPRTLVVGGWDAEYLDARNPLALAAPQQPAAVGEPDVGAVHPEEGLQRRGGRAYRDGADQRHVRRQSRPVRHGGVDGVEELQLAIERQQQEQLSHTADLPQRAHGPRLEEVVADGARRLQQVQRTLRTNRREHGHGRYAAQQTRDRPEGQAREGGDQRSQDVHAREQHLAVDSLSRLNAPYEPHELVQGFQREVAQTNVEVAADRLAAEDDALHHVARLVHALAEGVLHQQHGVAVSVARQGVEQEVPTASQPVQSVGNAGNHGHAHPRHRPEPQKHRNGRQMQVLQRLAHRGHGLAEPGEPVVQDDLRVAYQVDGAQHLVNLLDALRDVPHREVHQKRVGRAAELLKRLLRQNDARVADVRRPPHNVHQIANDHVLRVHVRRVGQARAADVDGERHAAHVQVRDVVARAAAQRLAELAPRHLLQRVLRRVQAVEPRVRVGEDAHVGRREVLRGGAREPKHRYVLVHQHQHRLPNARVEVQAQRLELDAEVGDLAHAEALAAAGVEGDGHHVRLRLLRALLVLVPGARAHAVVHPALQLVHVHRRVPARQRPQHGRVAGRSVVHVGLNPPQRERKHVLVVVQGHAELDERARDVQQLLRDAPADGRAQTQDVDLEHVLPVEGARAARLLQLRAYGGLGDAHERGLLVLGEHGAQLVSEPALPDGERRLAVAEEPQREEPPKGRAGGADGVPPEADAALHVARHRQLVSQRGVYVQQLQRADPRVRPAGHADHREVERLLTEGHARLRREAHGDHVPAVLDLEHGAAAHRLNATQVHGQGALHANGAAAAPVEHVAQRQQVQQVHGLVQPRVRNGGVVLPAAGLAVLALEQLEGARTHVEAADELVLLVGVVAGKRHAQPGVALRKHPAGSAHGGHHLAAAGHALLLHPEVQAGCVEQHPVGDGGVLEAHHLRAAVHADLGLAEAVAHRPGGVRGALWAPQSTVLRTRAGGRGSGRRVAELDDVRGLQRYPRGPDAKRRGVARRGELDRPLGEADRVHAGDLHHGLALDLRVELDCRAGLDGDPPVAPLVGPRAPRGVGLAQPEGVVELVGDRRLRQHLEHTRAEKGRRRHRGRDEVVQPRALDGVAEVAGGKRQVGEGEGARHHVGFAGAVEGEDAALGALRVAAEVRDVLQHALPNRQLETGRREVVAHQRAVLGGDRLLVAAVAAAERDGVVEPVDDPLVGEERVDELRARQVALLQPAALVDGVHRLPAHLHRDHHVPRQRAHGLAAGAARCRGRHRQPNGRSARRTVKERREGLGELGLHGLEHEAGDAHRLGGRLHVELPAQHLLEDKPAVLHVPRELRAAARLDEQRVQGHRGGLALRRARPVQMVVGGGAQDVHVEGHHVLDDVAAFQRDLVVLDAAAASLGPVARPRKGGHLDERRRKYGFRRQVRGDNARKGGLGLR